MYPTYVVKPAGDDRDVLKKLCELLARVEHARLYPSPRECRWPRPHLLWISHGNRRGPELCVTPESFL